MNMSEERRGTAPEMRTSRPGPTWHSIPPERATEEEQSLLRRLRSRFIRLAPKPIVRVLARPYVAGETRAEALAVVQRLHTEKAIHSTVDVLGEAISQPAETRAMLDEYVGTLDALGRCPHANISIKLSALGQGLDDVLCAENLEVLLKRATAFDQFVRFDMEDHTTIDSTLGFYERFVGRFPRIGVVLQSRLFRTPEDVKRLAPLKPNVRLCIGIYREPPEVAFVDKPAMKKRLLDLLAAMWENGQYVAVATHDENVIRRALNLAKAMNKGPESFEIQMLLGVPRAAIQQELRGMGIRVRLYVPYGTHWYQYCLRRVEHNPEMASLVLKNLLRIG